MKKIKYFLATAAIILSTFSLSSQTIDFEKKRHDYGTVKEEEGKITCKFKFTNTGDKNLNIKKVNASCGCTASDYTKEEIEPGEEGFVSATYNTKGRPGKFRKAVTVSSNDPKNPNTVLFIKGKVTPREKTTADHYPHKMGNLRLKTNHMAFMDVKRTEVAKDTIGIYNQWEKTMNLTFGNVPDHIKVKAIPEKIKPKQEGYLIFTYDANEKDDYGLIFERLYLLTNDDKKSKKLINISARLKEDFSDLTEKELENAPVASYNKTKHHFGKVKSGTKHTYKFVLQNKGENKLKIRKVQASCGCTATKPVKRTLEKGEKTDIKVTFNTHGRSGKQHKTVKVFTNDPENFKKTLHIQANIQ